MVTSLSIIPQLARRSRPPRGHFLRQPYPGRKLASRTIRLVAVEPGSFGDPLECTLEMVSVDSLPPYRALSYTWGDTKDRRQISLNRQSFHVNQNLYAALQRLRHERQRQLYWIDMLCIDQANIEEQSQQVRFMSDIHTKAVEVDFWLADTAYDSAEGGDDLDTRHVSAAKAFLEQLADHKCYEVPEKNPMLKAHLDTISTILACSWWTRVWTVQEAILPQKANVLVGPMGIPWETLVQAARGFMVQSERPVCEHSTEYRQVMTKLYQKVTVIQWIRELRKNDEQLNLSFILHAFRHRQCTDLKDKVFAFLGLVPKLSANTVVRPDYSRDIPYVLGTIFEKLLVIENDLNLLVRQKEKKRQLSLPTWMPDLTAEVESLHSDLHMYIMYHLPRFFDASCRKSKGRFGAPLYPHEIKLSSACLSVKGLPFDKVLEVKKPDPQSPRTNGEAPHVEILRSFKDPGKVYGGDLEYSLWRLINFDQVVIKTPQAPRSIQVRTRRIKFGDYLGRHPPHQPSEVMAQFLPLFSCFTTVKGYIGFGPHDMKEGDDVCILLGASVPFVLRPVEGGTKHEFVGHCFVQGIMDGEALKGRDMDHLKYINMI